VILASYKFILVFEDAAIFDNLNYIILQ
jgi:hypothetical protein